MSIDLTEADQNNSEEQENEPEGEIDGNSPSLNNENDTEAPKRLVGVIMY